MPVHKAQKAQKRLQTCQYFVKYLNKCLNKCLNILNLFYLNISVDLGSNSVPNIAYYQCQKNGKSAINNRKTFGVLLTDLSKAFDCLSHDLLIAKLNAYGFSIAALRLVQNYLSNRKQRTKINSGFSSWEEILFVVLQGSILGPFLFNIFLCDLFFIMNETDFASYVDDSTTYRRCHYQVTKFVADTFPVVS